MGDLLECIVHRVDEGMPLLDEANAIIRCNNAACQILGLPAQQTRPGTEGMEPQGLQSLPPVVLRPVSQGELHYEGDELLVQDKVFQVVGRERELNFGDCARVFVFHDPQVMHKNAYRLTAMADRVGLDVFVGESEAMQHLKTQIRTFVPPATTLVIGESGPGNVRELQNAMEYIANLAGSPCVVTGDMLPEKITHFEDTVDTTTLHLPTIERLIIEKALAPHGGPKAGREEKERVADQLGIGIATLYRKLKAYARTD